MLKRLLYLACDILVPRFLTEDVACVLDGDGCYVLTKLMRWVESGEKFDGVMTVKCFNLFGWALFAQIVGGVRPWPAADVVAT